MVTLYELLPDARANLQRRRQVHEHVVVGKAQKLAPQLLRDLLGRLRHASRAARGSPGAAPCSAIRLPAAAAAGPDHEAVDVRILADDLAPRVCAAVAIS